MQLVASFDVEAKGPKAFLEEHLLLTGGARNGTEIHGTVVCTDLSLQAFHLLIRMHLVLKVCFQYCRKYGSNFVSAQEVSSVHQAFDFVFQKY